MERPEDTGAVVPVRDWRYWLLKWNVLELFPFCCAWIGLIIGVAVSSFIAGYVAGKSWLENLVVKKTKED